MVIETPKGSRNKYAFDEKQKIFALKKVLPAGMAFPYDSGFIPSTITEDGDPVDVLALMDEPGAVGCLLQCRLVGIIEGEQGKKKDAERNDGIVAIERDNHRFPYIRHVKDRARTGRFLRKLPSANWREIPDIRRKGTWRSRATNSRWNSGVQKS